MSASAVVARRVRQLRGQRGWSAEDLARRLAELDPSTNLDRNVIANIENGRRRSLSLDEVVLFAVALDTTPTMLLLPALGEALSIGTDGPPLASTTARRWLGGHDSQPLPIQDEHLFRRERGLRYPGRVDVGVPPDLVNQLVALIEQARIEPEEEQQ